MSHFSVLVVTDCEPTEEVLTKVMQPYHEFECTGVDDEYIQDVDRTEEALAEFNSKMETMLKSPDGELHRPYDDKFYRDPTDDEAKHIGPFGGTGCGNGIQWYSKDWGDGRGYRAKVQFIPEGWEEVEAPLREVQSFMEWATDYYGTRVVPFGEKPDLHDKHKYGYCLLNSDGTVSKLVRRTNANKKWDYWRVGGRYRAKLKAKAGAVSGVSSEPSWEWNFNNGEPVPEGLDICKREDLDLDAMKRERVAARRKWLDDKLTDAVSTYDDYLTGYRAEQVYKKVWLEMEHPRPRGDEYAYACRAWLEANGYSPRDAMLAYHVARMWDNPEIPDGVTIEQWIDDAPPLTAFAVVMNGQWYEKGEMGWWACVSNEDDQWESKFNDLFESIPGDHYISILDCHI